jgi:hypothetical protein
VTTVGWHRARSAAWAEFGRRYWRVIVGLEIARRSAPAVLAGLAVAAVGVLVWWLVAHTPSPSSLSAPNVDAPGRWWYWLAGLLLAALGWWVVRRRNPYHPPTPHRGARRVATAVAALAAVAVFLLWREA